jgi:hypothetical protein
MTPSSVLNVTLGPSRQSLIVDMLRPPTASSLRAALSGAERLGCFYLHLNVSKIPTTFVRTADGWTLADNGISAPDPGAVSPAVIESALFSVNSELIACACVDDE